MQTEKIYNHFISEKNQLENEFISIGLHSKGVSEYLVAKSRDFENLSQWFHIANGIKELEYDGINYDSGFFMCRPAYEYETERQELFQRLVKEITLFSYLYSGLEAVITELNPPKCPKNKGKINAACYLIKNSFADHDSKLKLYSETVSLTAKMFSATIDKNYNLNAELKNSCVNTNALGLRLLYKVRNMIMHGDFFFPEPLDHSFIPPLQPEIIRLSSRLILISTQIILLTQIDRKSDDEIMIYNSSIIDFEDEDPIVNERNYLSGMHTKRPNYNSEQLDLELE